MRRTEPYDLFVIGAGPGGYTAALLGAKRGMRVGIAEASNLGGTCTNTGCIPAKSYIESVNLLDRLKNAQRFGIESTDASLSLESLHRRKTRIVARLVKGIEHLLVSSGVDIYRAHASFESANSIRVGDALVASRATIVATGSRPKRPAIFSLEGVMTSDDIFELKQIPASLVVVGGGVIGLEMAHIFSHLGSEVTVVEALERVLATEDEEVSKALVALYRKVRFITSARITSVERDIGFNLDVQTPGGMEALTGQGLLLSIGREPLIPEGLVSLGLEMNASGGARVDAVMRTSIPGVFAIGDATGEHMYAYVASKEAAVAVDCIAGGSMKMDYSAIPSIVFTSPEIASVGRRPNASRARKGAFPVSALGRARTMEASEGFASVYTDMEGKMERVTIMAPHATELISWAALAVEKKMHLEDFLKPYYPHPTMAELVREAAEDCLGVCINKT